MKFLTLILMIVCLSIHNLESQKTLDDTDQIYELISQYQEARGSKDSTLLSSILTDGIDQLVSSGNWRRGKLESMAGMMRSSTRNRGKRTLEIETVRFITPRAAIADARYTIDRDDGNVRKMWSSFIVVKENNSWKITAIRNMLPAR